MGSTGNLIRPSRPVLSASKEALLRKRLQGAFKTLHAGPQIPVRSQASPAPLSFAQQRLWFLQQLEPESAAYNEPTALRLTGPLDFLAFEQALNHIHERHAVLRARFPAQDGTPMQVDDPKPVSCNIIDLQGLPGPKREHAINQVLQEEPRKPFNLAEGPVARYTLIRCTPDDHLFLIVMHHIVTDGWSVTLFFRELEALYESLTCTSPAQLPSLPIQYSDFAAWQRQTLDHDALQRDLDYWKRKLRGAPAAIELPTDRDERGSAAAGGASQTLQLSRPFCQALNTETHARGVTEFMMLAAALALTLHRWTGQEDLMIGTVAAGRTQREIENLIGCFMNFLPLRLRLPSDASGDEVLATVKAATLEAYAHQDCPFDKIVEAINPTRGVHRNPLYNVALLLQNFPSGVLNSDVLSAEFVPVETRASLLDLRFIAEQNADGLAVVCEYDTALFDPSTIETLLEAFRGTLQRLVEEPSATMSEFALPQPLAIQAAAVRARREARCIALAATFTADPLQDSLLFWLHELDVAAKLALAPYNQVFQQLLDPASILNGNHAGLNVVLLRIQDWCSAQPAGDARAHLAKTVAEFSSAFRAAAGRSSVPWLVCFCPSAAAPDAELTALEQTLVSDLQGMAGVHVLPASEVLRLYPVENVFDTAADRLGNVPYTPLFFAALGTAIVRKFHALTRSPGKVIALDCDNTLWDGVCGEDGPRGIRLEPERKALQEFMRRQSEAGMLLCLCTKNNEADIAEVFKCRSDFPLRRENFVAAKVNWRSKSENLKALARELNLGLDSFIFVDDNPMECAEVEANCPGVLALRLPDDPKQIPSFLEHAWVFDHLKVTAADQKRAQLYQENRQREELRAQSVSMAEFLSGLNLDIVIEEARPEQFSRVAQLTQRTNQFNSTTRRYADGEIQQLGAAAGRKLFAVSVSDRFGDYGLVGVMIARLGAESLEVDSFMLSCRVLGKGVEYRMLAQLGELAQAHNLSRVDLHFRPSAKNRPVLDFFEKVASAFRRAQADGSVFALPTRFAASIRYEPEEVAAPQPEPNGATVQPATAAARFVKCRAIALQSHDPNWILQSVEEWGRAHRGDTTATTAAEYVAPRDPTERELCAIWAELLGLERVGIHDDFFALGGSSLLAVRLFAQIEKLLGKALPLVILFQCPTIEKLARAIDQRKGRAAATSIVPIQTAGSKPPLVLVHGAGGGILWGYANLSTHLGQDQPVYAIEPRLAAAGHTSLTVEEMARQYLADLRAFQPKGPYYLGGYCFGGYVAYEMACLLHAAGEPVALVALLDAAAPNSSYQRIPWWNPLYYFRFARNTAYWLADYLRLDRRDQWRFITRKLAVARRRIFGVPASQQQNVIDLEEYIDPSHFPEEELKLWQVHLNAGGTYKPQPYPGCVTLLRTRGQPFLCSFDPRYGWGELTAKVDVRVLPGSHEAIFIEPGVRAFAAQVAACMRQARAGSK